MAPERMANLLAPAFQLVLLRPPTEVEGFTMSQLWHERVHHDAAHAWLRKQIADASAREQSEPDVPSPSEVIGANGREGTTFRPPDAR